MDALGGSCGAFGGKGKSCCSEGQGGEGSRGVGAAKVSRHRRYYEGPDHLRKTGQSGEDLWNSIRKAEVVEHQASAAEALIGHYALGSDGSCLFDDYDAEEGRGVRSDGSCPKGLYSR